MKVKNINAKIREISAENGYVHKIDTDTYFKRGMMLTTDTLDMYEEVDKIPAYTKAEYDAKVNELVREKYTQAEEDAIKRKMINTMMTPMTLSDERVEYIINEYTEFNNYVEECLERAKDEELYKHNDE